MSHLYLDGVLTYGADPLSSCLTDEAYELERDYGMRMHSTSDPVLPRETIDSILARADTLGWKIRLIQSPDRHGVYVWWADLYHPARVARKHGYGDTMLNALREALDAEEVIHEVPTFSPQHKVAEYREIAPAAPMVRRF